MTKDNEYCNRCDLKMATDPVCSSCKEAIKNETVHDLNEIKRMDRISDGLVYAMTQTENWIKDGDVMLFTNWNDEKIVAYQYMAWPVQIAGPRQEELHIFAKASRIDQILGEVALRFVNRDDCEVYAAEAEKRAQESRN